ncbi:response regulator [Pelovirga terrestris]|uniref:Response regulator n=1 Tax=Pelovirga terrestris TaxID=2771352 RepID=A0A8J6QZD6_9BACT|nr:response regulator [Pelovirga terrestris]MBD1401232.1 response regulator [Pelovirga terrestris]
MPNQVKILCVDDEKNVLKALRRTFMEHENFSIYLAESGAEGLTTLESVNGIQLVISDYRMPGMNGVEFLRQVNERWPSTIRIVLSGYADTAVVVEAVNQGHIYKFMPKPWDDDDLLINISAALEYQRIRQENTSLNIKLKEKNQELEKKNIELHTFNHHLEELVAQRTQQIELRNRVLQLSQAILDKLPFPVFGIDTENFIVQGNDIGCKLFSSVDTTPLGLHREGVFPADINTLIDQLITSEKPRTGVIKVAGKPYCCRVCRLDKISEGIVLVLVPPIATAASDECFSEIP